ncbi:MAG: prephenate dehydrogenase/arogenate dehydrogenase family protein [Verrucomicrobia bacterium]|nr:prephenate dehydrogenase/arogenate dehydrogenase family protein [Verrucomicrobiota bacterium]
MSPSKITVFAPGLIGGSVALACSHFFPQAKLAIWTRRPESLPRIRTALPKAEVGTDPGLARSSDLVVLATPPTALPDLVRSILPHLSPSSMVTDVSSVKESVEENIAPLLKDKARWIGSHPMAGSEDSGLSAARAGLFQNAPVILTPTASTSAATLKDATSFWIALGARVISMSPQIHDDQVARISHLPHFLAAALVLAAGKGPLPLAGPGYRDTTRVAAGPARLWAEILLQNRRGVLSAIREFRSATDNLFAALENGDAQSLEKILDEAAGIRRTLPPLS